MAKTKKLKKYKAPDAKYLVVIDPWPSGKAGHPRFIDNVAAWFEFMLRDDHPGETVRTIYTQGTHNNIIVELSESVDIQPYIGVHAHRRFLISPYEDTEAVSYIYEYDYETQNDPTRRSWTARYPSSYDISIFPFKVHYPIPTPAPLPPIHINYAKRPRVTPPPPAIAVQDRSEPPPSDASTMRSRTLSPPLLREDPEEVKPVVKKKDPYEEDDDAARLLRTGSRDVTLQTEQDLHLNSVGGFVKEEPIGHTVPPSTREASTVDHFLASILVKPMDHVPHQSVPIKEEPFESHAADFLVSIPIKKEESMSHVSRRSVSINDEPVDAQDLPAEFNPPPATALPGPVKSEPAEPTGSEQILVKPESKDESLPPPLLNRTRDSCDCSMTLSPGRPVESATRPILKLEPQEDNEYQPSAELVAALADLPAGMYNPSPAPALPKPVKSERAEPTGSEQIFIKPEPEDQSLPPPLHNRPRYPCDRSMMFSPGRPVESVTRPIIKPEPQDNYPIPSLARAPDPRLVRRQTQEQQRMEEMNHGRVRLPVFTEHVRDPRLLRREQGMQSSKRYNGREEAEAGRLKRIKSEE